MSVIVLLEVQVKPESVDELKGLFKEILPATRAYDGCREIDLPPKVVPTTELELPVF